MLKLRDVYYKSENTSILNGITMEIKSGDCVSIIGSSGSGKSTLLKICADLIPLSNGEIYFKGENYSSYNPIELRKRISYCVQLPHLFGDSVYENLAFPFKIRNQKVDNYKIIKFLKKFNLDESTMKKDITALSGGEKQRVAIIRNLLFTPEILLLDEATSALDKENAENVEKYIQELNRQGVTILWITHNINQSQGIFNKRIVISEGKIENVEVLK